MKKIVEELINAESNNDYLFINRYIRNTSLEELREIFFELLKMENYDAIDIVARINKKYRFATNGEIIRNILSVYTDVSTVLHGEKCLNGIITKKEDVDLILYQLSGSNLKAVVAIFLLHCTYSRHFTKKMADYATNWIKENMDSINEDKYVRDMANSIANNRQNREI